MQQGLSQERFWPIFLTTFFLTLTNPMTILSFIAIYAGLGVGMGENNMLEAGVVTGGVFSGSALFYLCLSFVISRFRRKLPLSSVLWLNRVSGCIILGFGAASIASACG